MPAAIAPGLASLGYAVEVGKTTAGKIKRPVLFGENGVPSVSCEIDAVNDAEGIVVEVAAARGPAATPPTATSSAPC